MNNYFKALEQELAPIAQWYNLADKTNLTEWSAYLDQLQAKGVDTAEAAQKAIDICHGRAIPINPKKEEVVIAEEVKPVRYKTKFGEMLSGCETLEDFISLGGVS